MWTALLIVHGLLASKIGRTVSLLTLVGGRIVHAAEPFAAYEGR